MRILDDVVTSIDLRPDERVEPMSLRHIDIAVVNRVGAVLSRIATPKLAQWAQRPLKERVMLGEFDSPKRFLLAMAKAGVAKNQLPAIYVTREPGLIFGDPTSSGAKDAADIAVIENEAGKAVALIDQSVISFTYIVNFVGWNDEDIEPLAALYCMWLRHKNMDKTIEIKTKLADAELITGGKFSDGPLTSAVNASVPYEQDKLRSLSVSATFDVDFLQARYVDEFTTTTEFALNVIGSS